MRLVLLVPVLSIGCAALPTDRPASKTDQPALAKALAGLTAKTPLACLPIGSQRYVSTAYGPVLVYTVTRGLVYVNRTTGGCEGIARGDVMASIQYQDRTCAGDVVHTLHPVTRLPTGSCTLGVFTPYGRSRGVRGRSG